MDKKPRITITYTQLQDLVRDLKTLHAAGIDSPELLLANAGLENAIYWLKMHNERHGLKNYNH